MARETLPGDDGEPIVSNLEVPRADGALCCLIAKLFRDITWEKPIAVGNAQTMLSKDR